MNQPSHKSPLQFLVLVAMFCSFSSVGIVALAFCLIRDISADGMWAIAAMAAAPALMGIAFAYFTTKHLQQDT